MKYMKAVGRMDRLGPFRPISAQFGPFRPNQGGVDLAHFGPFRPVPAHFGPTDAGLNGS